MISPSKQKALPITPKVRETTMQPHLACLQPVLAQMQVQNSLLQLQLVDLFAVPAGSDLGSKDAGWLLHGEPRDGIQK
jgi:hypothetical protein